MAKQVKDVYAGALFDVAQEDDRIDDFWEEAQALLGVLGENPELSEMMTHPRIGEEQKASILEAVLKDRVSNEMFALCDTLREKGHFPELPSVLYVFMDKVKEYKRIGVVYVKTPMELSSSQKKAVEDRILSTTDFVSLEMHYSIDASLIGGMVIRIGDRVVDSSVRSKLDSLTHALSAGR